jgi:tetratricopeptide (TPR) repeat protein
MKYAVILAPAVFLCLHAQDIDKINHERLSAFSGNKVVLVGEWKSEDISKWNNIIDSADLSGYGIMLLGRNNPHWMINLAVTQKNETYYDGNALAVLETWLRQQSGSLGSRWVAFDDSNKVITAGVKIPDAKALDSAMEQFGIKSKLKQLRDFVKEHPDHTDARADLLKEVRRRALLTTPKDVDKDLDEAVDLRTWGVLAREFDLAMNLSWIGFNLDFFRPNEDQPEKYSPLMKVVFRKHIGRVEAVLRELPTNQNLWDIWAWMARTLNDRPVLQFVQSLDPFDFNCPSPKVAVWLTSTAKAKEDWDSVVQLARLGRKFEGGTIKETTTWSPSRITISKTSIQFDEDAGFPEKASYYPLLEALLKLGRIEEANDIYDELTRRLRWTFEPRATAEIARSAGFEELTATWSKGLPTKQTPFCLPNNWGNPEILILADFNTPEYNQFKSLVNRIQLRWPLLPASNWKKQFLNWAGDDFRWALIAGDGLVIADGTKIPTATELMEILEGKGIKTTRARAEEFLRNSPDHTEALVALGVENIFKGMNALQLANIGEQSKELDSDQDEAIWGNIARPWNKIMGHEYAIYSVPYFYINNSPLCSSTMKSLSRRFLAKIEAAIKRSPSSDSLWNLWIFWRNAGDNERSIEALLESIQPSPAEIKGTCPPAMVLEIYYNECKTNNQWPQIVKLLTDVWDREISEQLLDNKTKERAKEQPQLLYPELGDNVGFSLIEALLNVGKHQEADDVFNTWLTCGGSFSNATGLVELARLFAADRLAKAWEVKVKR